MPYFIIAIFDHIDRFGLSINYYKTSEKMSEYIAHGFGYFHTQQCQSTLTSEKNKATDYFK